jgi:hypothetical protein
MSNRALLNLMRGGISDFHVGRGSARDDGATRFAGERRDRVVTHYTFAAQAMHEDGKHDYSKKENREVKSKKRPKDDDGSTSGDESASDTEGPKKKKRIYRRGEDADVIALYCSNTPSLSLSDPRAVPHRETARPARARARRWTGRTRIATASPTAWRRRSEHTSVTPSTLPRHQRRSQKISPYVHTSTRLSPPRPALGFVRPLHTLGVHFGGVNHTSHSHQLIIK